MKISTRGPEAPAAGPERRPDLTVREPERLRRLVARGLSAAQRGALTRIARAADAAGLRVYLVGGAVRDVLLRRRTQDLDVAVEGDARALAGRLGGALRGHPAFGTATVELEHGVRVDLATTRRESYPHPAALPEVRRAGLAEDLARRDFTVNALAVPLDASGALGLIDPFRGLADLRGRRVRVLHARSFVDDPTRLLRAVHLAALLDFEIEPVTARRMRADAAGLERLSAARLRNELARTLESERADRAVHLLARFRLPAHVDAGWSVAHGAARQVAALGRALGRLRMRQGFEPVAAWPVVLALLLASADPGAVPRVIERLKPDRGVRAALLDAVLALSELPRALAAAATPSRVHAACRRHTSAGLLAVLAAAPPSGATARRVRSYLERWRDVRADIDGSDLLAAGVAPGPAVARGLAAALAAKLDGQASARPAQLALALAAARRA